MPTDIPWARDFLDSEEKKQTYALLVSGAEIGRPFLASRQVPADRLAALQRTNPKFYTIAYINCSAEVKALSDVICTSGNAVRIVEQAPADRNLLFVPDENLGQWVMEQTRRPMTLWKGNCYAHVEFQRERVLAAKKQYPDAKIIVHPESLREVRDLADAVDEAHRLVGEEGRGFGLPEHGETARLVEVGGDLGEELVGGEPDRDSDADLLLDPGGEIASKFGSSRFPETFLINTEGLIDNKLVGAQPWGNPQIEPYLQRLRTTSYSP